MTKLRDTTSNFSFPRQGQSILGLWRTGRGREGIERSGWTCSNAGLLQHPLFWWRDKGRGHLLVMHKPIENLKGHSTGTDAFTELCASTVPCRFVCSFIWDPMHKMSPLPDRYHCHGCHAYVFDRARLC